MKRLGGLKYKVAIYWSESDKSYIAEVPELPGCVSDGETYEKALKNVRVIVDEWIDAAKIEGRKTPKAN